jgi:hypothetical protein
VEGSDPLHEQPHADVAHPRERHLDHHLVERLLVRYVDDREAAASDETAERLEVFLATS